MARYRTEVVELVLAGNSVVDSDSELEEDPAFPLPTLDSEEESPLCLHQHSTACIYSRNCTQHRYTSFCDFR